MSTNGGPVAFSEVVDGHRVCRLCRHRATGHLATCPLVALDLHVRELAGHIGMCVAGVQDTLETIGRLLRDAPPEES